MNDWVIHTSPKLLPVPYVVKHMAERRKVHRFDLEQRATIVIGGPGQVAKTFEFVTRDISAGGAFFQAREPLSEGMRVHVRLTITSTWLKEITESRGILEVGAAIVRSGREGMAICFDADYRFFRSKA